MKTTTYYGLAAMELVDELLEAGGGHPSQWARARRLSRLAGVELDDVLASLRGR